MFKDVGAAYRFERMKLLQFRTTGSDFANKTYDSNHCMSAIASLHKRGCCLHIDAYLTTYTSITYIIKSIYICKIYADLQGHLCLGICYTIHRQRSPDKRFCQTYWLSKPSRIYKDALQAGSWHETAWNKTESVNGAKPKHAVWEGQHSPQTLIYLETPDCCNWFRNSSMTKDLMTSYLSKAGGTYIWTSSCQHLSCHSSSISATHGCPQCTRHSPLPKMWFQVIQLVATLKWSGLAAPLFCSGQTRSTVLQIFGSKQNA